MEENHYLIPTQLNGHEKNIECRILLNTIEDAEDWFVGAKERLLDVNNWKKYSAITSIDFRLTDSHGKPLNRKAHKGDHIKIDVPEQSTGFDWVVIEAIEYDDYPDADGETFALRVRPAEDPADGEDGFAAGNATSTMVIERRGKKLAAFYHGRNQSNIDNTVNPAENAAWFGLSDAQLAGLIKGLID